MRRTLTILAILRASRCSNCGAYTEGAGPIMHESGCPAGGKLARVLILLMLACVLGGCQTVLSPRTVQRVLRPPNPAVADLTDRCFRMSNGMMDDEWRPSDRGWYIQVRLYKTNF